MSTTGSAFPGCREPVTALLRLPHDVRDAIYRFVGLASWNGSPYTFDLHGEERRHPRSGPSPSTFHGLLLSCRGIYGEAAALLYSANRFYVHYTDPQGHFTDPGSLAPLLSLTPFALSCLSALKIVLNHSSCHQRTRLSGDRDCCSFSDYASCQNPGFNRHGHQPPLLCPCPWLDDDGPIAAAQAVLSEWRTAASYLSSFVIPARLELSLVCDIDTRQEEAVELAKSLVAPLRLFRHSLRTCHIRLAKTPDLRLSQVAQDGVLESCGSIVALKPSSKPSLFLALPRELRLRILEFTDLVTPNREVWWCREDSKYWWKDIGGHSWNCEDASFTSPCRFQECWYRTITNSRTKAGWPIGCFCRRRHAAFSTTCTCWMPPGPSPFLVCRTTHEDAQLVFFSANRFIVHDFKRRPLAPGHLRPYQIPSDREHHPKAAGYPFRRLAASQFLRHVVPTHCITHLRFLELVFPPYSPSNCPQKDDPAMQDWSDAVGWLRDKINGPGLALRVVVPSPYGSSDDDYTDESMAAAEGGDAIDRGCHELLKPLEQLAEGPNGVARFYADLHFPWEGMYEWRDRNRAEVGERLGAKKAKYDRDTERRLLGDRYDQQYANRRKGPEKSLWAHVFYHHHSA